MHFDWLGDRAIRFQRPPVAARALVRELQTWPDVIDVVVAREDIALYFTSSTAAQTATAAHDRLAEAIANLATLTDDDAVGREHVLRVAYDGPDLEDVARATGLTVDDVIAAHSGRDYTVELTGFAPGFAYLDGLDPRLELPRRTTPRPRVAAGSLAIAGVQTAVYPFAGPGGWHLIGRVTEARMFDEHGPLLALGDRVRFVK
jgi:KipI family sensor histidine kinase inhibitor